MNKKSLQILVFLILIINIVTTVFLVALTDRSLGQFTAQASSAEFELCINAPPEVVVPCNATLVQDQEFSCQLNFTDQDLGQNHTFGVAWPNHELFTITQDGFINWTPTNDESGRNYTAVFSVDDNVGCSNSETIKEWDFMIQNINDPPVFDGPIPDQNITVNTTSFLFSLSTYFSDPDGDPLTYTIAAENSPFELSITSGGAFTARTSVCEPENVGVRINASDPFNESVTSNLFFVNVDCPDPDDGSGAGEQAAGSGAGGGGGDAGVCRSNWECLGWEACLPTGSQWMRCYDLNGCEEPRFLNRECEYTGPEPTCDENWLCEDWGPCQPEGLQHRDCEDLARCDSTIFKPITEQTCEYEETTIRPPLIETPSFVEPERFNMWLLFIILASSFLVIGGLRVYHEELLRSISKLKLFLVRRKQQELWLTKEQRSYYLQELQKTEQQLKEEQPYEQITQLARKLFSDLSQQPIEMMQKEFMSGIQKRKPSKELELLLTNVFERIYALEQERFELYEPLFYSYTEELRLVVCLLSPQNVYDIERPLKEFDIGEEDSYLQEAIIRSVRIFRALQFDQQHFAQEEYEKLITTYEDMPQEEQELLYEDTQKTFTLIYYSRERLSN